MSAPPIVPSGDNEPAAPLSDAKVPLYETHRGFPERRVPLSLDEIEELLVLIGDESTPQEDVLAQVERKLLFHRNGFIADLDQRQRDEQVCPAAPVYDPQHCGCWIFRTGRCCLCDEKSKP